jgi:hypothetical protein
MATSRLTDDLGLMTARAMELAGSDPDHVTWRRAPLDQSFQQRAA